MEDTPLNPCKECKGPGLLSPSQDQKPPYAIIGAPYTIRCEYIKIEGLCLTNSPEFGNVPECVAWWNQQNPID